MVPYEVTHNVDLAGHSLRDSSGHVVAVYGPAPHPIWLTIFTSMFMHGGLLHIGGNMLYLWIFGNNIEDALGKFRFLVFYLVCGFVAALSQILSGPNSPVPTLGASGAIAGVLGAYLILYRRRASSASCRSSASASSRRSRRSGCWACGSRCNSSRASAAAGWSAAAAWPTTPTSAALSPA